MSGGWIGEVLAALFRGTLLLLARLRRKGDWGGMSLSILLALPTGQPLPQIREQKAQAEVGLSLSVYACVCTNADHRTKSCPVQGACGVTVLIPV